MPSVPAVDMTLTATRELERLSEALARARREVAAAEVPPWHGPAALRYDVRRRLLEGRIARLARTAEEVAPVVMAHVRSVGVAQVPGSGTVAAPGLPG